MQLQRSTLRSAFASLMLAASFLVAAPLHAANPVKVEAPVAAPVSAKLTNESCLSCHATGKDKITVNDGEGKQRVLKAHDEAKFAKGVHGKLECVSCHTNIIDSKANHAHSTVVGEVQPNCATCHEKLWAKVQAEGKAKEKPRLGVVVANIEAYKQSFHARPDTDNPKQPKASCESCHDTHSFAVPAAGSPEHAKFRLGISETCGASCHEDQLEAWKESVHGQKVTEDGDSKAAVCVDCHTAHAVQNTSAVSFKTVVTKDCGTCHEDNFASYRESLHGKINALGYGNTAKCYDCHGSHEILKVDDKNSKVHPDKVLKTCSTCHDGKKARMAADGFKSFPPHGNAHDFAKYPQIWLAAKGMAALLIGTFAFFWLHLVLWLNREWQDRKHGKTRPLIKVAELGLPAGKHISRFGPWARLGHLLFAISLMVLTLTGMTLMYASSDWAPVVIRLLGGPETMAIIHRVCAVIFVGIFVIHLIWVVQFLARNWKTFDLFGPDSVNFNMQDLKDVIAMFKWFLGKGERPVFDRWTYWEKFDYWAPFWGVTIVGSTGLVMWFPTLTATYLPGWVFNVAAIAHGEEAFLAAVFLFTVHFFNNHFRPDKFPLDIVMFTGTMSLEHFARDHAVQYRRLLESGELAKLLVDAPTPAMTLRSRILGVVLIAFGLSLLTLVSIGFYQSFAG